MAHYEAEAKRLFHSMGMLAYKHRDRQKCPRCGHLLYKAEAAPDYSVFFPYAGRLCHFYVEVKYGRRYWSFSDENKGVRPLQREKLSNTDNLSWLFIVLGDGRAPKGRGAFLVPWDHWQEIEEKLLTQGQKSIGLHDSRNPGAESTLAEYRLEWERGTGWAVPENHIFIQFWKGELCPLQPYVQMSQRYQMSSNGSPMISMAMSAN